MNRIKCPNCKMRIVLHPDGTCPNCKKLISSGHRIGENSPSLRQHIYTSMVLKDTYELLEILELHDTNEWTDVAFDVIKEILQDRNVGLPNQHDQNNSVNSKEIAKMHFDRSNEFLDKSNYENALEECDKAIKLAPGWSEAYKLRGLILEKLDKPSTSILDSREAVRLLNERKRVNQLNVVYTLVWAVTVLAGYICLPLFWTRGVNFLDFGNNPYIGFYLLIYIAILFVLGWLWIKTINSSPFSCSKRWIKILLSLVASVVAGIIVFQFFFTVYANFRHNRSILKDLEFKEVASATFPGDHYQFMIWLATPSINGIAVFNTREAVFRRVGETPWSADLSMHALLLEDDRLQLSQPKPGTGLDREGNQIGVSTFSPPPPIKAQLDIPDNNILAPFQVNGTFEITATYPILYGVDKYQLVYEGQMQSQKVSFWVFPREMEREVLLEVDMYKRTTFLFPTLLIACTALIPISFLLMQNLLPETKPLKQKRLKIYPYRN